MLVAPFESQLMACAEIQFLRLLKEDEVCACLAIISVLQSQLFERFLQWVNLSTIAFYGKH